MSTTKEVKAILQELRARLDEETRPEVEPLLRTLLDVAKPKTVVETYAVLAERMSTWNRPDAMDFAQIMIDHIDGASP